MPKLSTIQYLRGGAALMVTWFHLTNTYPWAPVRQSGDWGWLGVEVFFVISGFVLPLSIWARHGREYQVSDFGAFSWRRIVRIEPPYLISVLFTAGLAYLSSLAPSFRGAPPDLNFVRLLSHVAYLPEVVGEQWLQGVYWSLAYEFCFYAVLGLTFPLLMRAPVATITLLPMLAMLMMLPHGWNGYVPLFAVGVAIFLGRVGRIRLPAMWVMVVAGTVACGVSSIPAALAAFATAVILHFACGWHARPAVHRVLFFLGAISYSLYITHVPVGGRVVNLGSRFVTSEIGRLGLSVLALGVSLAFATAFWYFIERRFAEMASRHGARARSHAAVVAHHHRSPG